MGLFRAIRKPRPNLGGEPANALFGPSLPSLATDGEVLIAGAPPRFPHALLLADVKLGEAVTSRDPARIEAARERLADGVRALIASDRDRLDKLPDGDEHTEERRFLHDRVLVLELRLAAVQHPVATPAAPPPAAPPRPVVVSRTPPATATLRPSAASADAPLASGGDGTSHAVA